MNPEERIAALEKEVAGLYLKLFWRDHCPRKLESQVIASSFAAGALRCRCMTCCLSGVSRESFTPGTSPKCQTLEAICALARRFDLTVEDRRPGSALSRCEMLDEGVYDQDCHLVLVATGGTNFFTYGSRLWKAASVQDPDLQRLAGLFVLLGRA